MKRQGCEQGTCMKTQSCEIYTCMKTQGCEIHTLFSAPPVRTQVRTARAQRRQAPTARPRANKTRTRPLARSHGPWLAALGSQPLARSPWLAATALASQTLALSRCPPDSTGIDECHRSGRLHCDQRDPTPAAPCRALFWHCPRKPPQ